MVRSKESFLRQKATSLWLKEGDSNTRFFHKFVKHRNRRNADVGLNGITGWLEYVTLVKEEICNNFERRFVEHSFSSSVLEGVDLAKLSLEDSMGIRCHSWNRK